jgi:2'-hydroxyisoflavone reductase
MRILMIGGTRFIGKHIVEAALANGHEVTIFHRGRSNPELFPDAVHLVGDRNDDLGALADGAWDVTIDTCAFVPRHVTALADVLGTRGGRYVFISSVSVYAGPITAGYREDAPLIELADPTVEEVTNETYGGLKVLCERAAVERFGAATLIVRPTYVVGPDDISWRFPWWVRRIAAGGRVLAPGPAADPAQVIDVRDMGTWIVSLVERGVTGAFHAVGPATAITWGELLGTIVATVGPPGTELVWIDEATLLAEGIDGSTIPLWSGGDPDRLMSAADPGAAVDTGLRHRALAETIDDTLAWTIDRECPPDAGLDPAREAELLARLAP